MKLGEQFGAGAGVGAVDLDIHHDSRRWTSSQIGSIRRSVPLSSRSTQTTGWSSRWMIRPRAAIALPPNRPGTACRRWRCRSASAAGRAGRRGIRTRRARWRAAQRTGRRRTGGVVPLVVAELRRARRARRCATRAWRQRVRSAAARGSRRRAGSSRTFDHRGRGEELRRELAIAPAHQPNTAAPSAAGCRRGKAKLDSCTMTTCRAEPGCAGAALAARARRDQVRMTGASKGGAERAPSAGALADCVRPAGGATTTSRPSASRRATSSTNSPSPASRSTCASGGALAAPRGLRPAIGLAAGAAGAALGLDDRLEAAGDALRVIGEAAPARLLRVRQGQSRGKFGQPGLVIVRAEDELDDRGHRRACLRLQPGILEQLGIIVGLGIGGEREIIGLAERAVERGAAATRRLLTASALSRATQSRSASPASASSDLGQRIVARRRRHAPSSSGVGQHFGRGTERIVERRHWGRRPRPGSAVPGPAASARSTSPASSRAVSLSAISFQLITP